jgi:hypothetical protein
MIEVRYRGRLGNQLFKYCVGRILAEGLGYRLGAVPLPHFSGTQSVIEGRMIESPVWECPENVRIIDLLADRKPRRIIVNGYMQHYRYYRRFKDKVRQWAEIGRSKVQPEEDALVVHMRLGDYLAKGWVLSLDYYHAIIAKENFRRLYIVTDEPESPLLSSFGRYHPTMVTGSPIESLRFIRSARRIVLSQSTYGWWGAFLSEADRIYFPVPRDSVWSPGAFSDLRVTDESRYIYVNDVETLPGDGVTPGGAHPIGPDGRARWQ